MIALVAVPLLLGGLLAATAGPLSRRVRPDVAVRLLTAWALSAALSTGLVLSAVAVLAGAQLGPLPSLGHWSASALRTNGGVPVPVGLAAMVVVAGCLAAATLRAGLSLRSLRLARRACASLSPSAGRLVVLPDAEPVAYAVGGSGGRIVVSTGMFAALSGPERRVLLAHEAAHLRHRHHLYIHLVRLAAAANPLLRPAVSAIEVATERWADEDAAAQVGDRGLAARALAHAALAGSAPPQFAGALAATQQAVAERVGRLLAAPPTLRPGMVALAATAALTGWVAAGAVTVWANDIVQLAEAVYLRH